MVRPAARQEDPDADHDPIRHSLGLLRTFFEHITDWDYDDAPTKVPIFPDDFPQPDEPLPKFLDDPTAAKFMAALATDPNPRRRLMVELLTRTGMRVGELAALRDDAMVRIGDTFWLRVPVGKLHNDRYVPLHPILVELITTYRHQRGPTPTGLLVERNDGHPFNAHDPRLLADLGPHRRGRVLPRHRGRRSQLSEQRAAPRHWISCHAESGPSPRRNMSRSRHPLRQSAYLMTASSALMAAICT